MKTKVISKVEKYKKEYENLVCVPNKDTKLQSKLAEEFINILEDIDMDRSIGFYALLVAITVYADIMGLVEKEFNFHMDRVKDIYEPSRSDIEMHYYEMLRKGIKEL